MWGKAFLYSSWLFALRILCFWAFHISSHSDSENGLTIREFNKIYYAHFYTFVMFVIFFLCTNNIFLKRKRFAVAGFFFGFYYYRYYIFPFLSSFSLLALFFAKPYVCISMVASAMWVSMCIFTLQNVRTYYIYTAWAQNNMSKSMLHKNADAQKYRCFFVGFFFRLSWNMAKERWKKQHSTASHSPKTFAYI